MGQSKEQFMRIREMEQDYDNHANVLRIKKRFNVFYTLLAVVRI